MNKIRNAVFFSLLLSVTITSASDSTTALTPVPGDKLANTVARDDTQKTTSPLTPTKSIASS
ncbi:hypothetical protein HN446_01195 [bacterium]|jgi:hypothetical protein|nr:hypothetical protein [bacterium]